MLNESLCKSCEYGDRNCPGVATYVFGCAQYEKRNPRTNGDRIRAMTDEELAKYLEGFGGTPPTCDTDGERDYKKCRDCWLDWLKQEVQE